MEDEPRIAAWDRLVDWPLTGLGVAFLACYAWQVLDTSLPQWGAAALDVVLTAIWVVFGLDYLIRIGMARRKWYFVGTHLLDLVILLLPMLRQLRALRVVTVISVLNRQLRDDFRGASPCTWAARSGWSDSSRRWPYWTPSGTRPTPRSPRSARLCGGR
ncbi:hypothetical protein [Pseudonocardia sp. H11422]|uniref:hypothetical protein n=1 Tax=Pseudonocardia sp. H11422 TaxID=2835866 RepID=UPI002027C6E3|nr:hypothetical protein [Pseudonocardia sp. H11422]